MSGSMITENSTALPERVNKWVLMFLITIPLWYGPVRLAWDVLMQPIVQVDGKRLWCVIIHLLGIFVAADGMNTDQDARNVHVGTMAVTMVYASGRNLVHPQHHHHAQPLDRSQHRVPDLDRLRHHAESTDLDLLQNHAQLPNHAELIVVAESFVVESFVAECIDDAGV